MNETGFMMIHSLKISLENLNNRFDVPDNNATSLPFRKESRYQEPDHLLRRVGQGRHRE